MPTPDEQNIHQFCLTYQTRLMYKFGMTMQPLSPDVAPLAFLQLAGHPLRWRLLEELARSDRVVSELTELVGEPQNLVSYHLAKLRDGRLVSARRSSADGRDTYYTVDLTRIGGGLSASGRKLHPGLQLTRAPRGAPRKGAAKARVLFLCTGNSARSQIAEALVKARSGGAVVAVSAGSQPKPLHPNAVRVMREEYGLDIAGHASKHFEVFADQRFDCVISLCDLVREVCPDFAGQPETIHWSMPNPATGETDAVTYPLFQQTAAELATRVEFLLAALADRTPPARPRRRKS
jgi:ArsR family transcriptional regulator, arsenate/arsenite/antimonite-responsive transcriptional repressor / arsenate reductase (thioredoxin)